MLIDDDPLLGDVVSASLSQEGYTVGVLPDGRGAVGIIEFKRPALVLLDCAMPFVPGIEVLRAIRASRICFAVPVLMLTARDQSSDRDIAMRAGATSYMCKPFDADRLVMTVDQMIGDDQQKHARFLVADNLRSSNFGR
jgi:DNA-binding response OmpR family regulator